MAKIALTDKDQLFLRFIGRHLGCLAIRVIAIDKDGKDVGEKLTETYSGFFITLNEQWFFVTAGHVFRHTDQDGNKRGLEDRLRRGVIRIDETDIIDYIGMDAKIHGPTIIDYETVLQETIFVNNDEFGLDFALLPLRDWYVTSVKGNGVAPFVEHTWQNEPDSPLYAVVGFPDEEKKPSPGPTSGIGGWIKPMLFIVEKCDLPSHIPTPPYPYFAARLPDTRPHRASGISGSPILAFKRIGNDMRYFLVGIDTAWYESDRIIVGCPMPYVVDAFLQILRASVSANNNTSEG